MARMGILTPRRNIHAIRTTIRNLKLVAIAAVPPRKIALSREERANNTATMAAAMSSIIVASFREDALTPQSPRFPPRRATTHPSPAVAHSLEISSASLCDNPSTQGAHHHRGWRHAVDPAGVMSGTRNQVAVRISQTFSRITNCRDARLVKRHRIKTADLFQT